MCNLYSETTNQQAIRDLFNVEKDFTGNLPSYPAIFPDNLAPVVRHGAAGRELMLMRWGMPAPQQFAGPPITNIRNTSSPHWRRWLAPQSRCLVPWTSFSEYNDLANPASLKDENGGRHPMAGILSGSPWIPTGRLPHSPACGRLGPERGGRRKTPSRGITLSTDFSRLNRTPLSLRSTLRPCQ